MATAASPDLTARVAELTTCSLCLEDFKTPRSLPCLHTFCEECLDKLFSRATDDHSTQQPADSPVKFKCPMCCRELTVPEGGARALEHNFYMNDLAETNRAVSRSSTMQPSASASSLRSDAPLCQSCASESKNVAMYCMDCCQKLCKDCGLTHQRMPIPHTVEAWSKEFDSYRNFRRGPICEQCPGQKIAMYCRQCKKNICVVCFATEHGGHSVAKIDVVAKEFHEKIGTDIKYVTEALDGVAAERKHLVQERDRFLQEIDGTSISLKQAADEIKKEVDRRVAEIMENLEHAKAGILKEVTNRQDHLETQFTSLDGFRTFATGLKTKGDATDITRGGEKLHRQAEELVKSVREKPALGRDFRIPQVVPTISEVDEFRQAVNELGNFVGRVDFFNYSLEPTVIEALPIGDPVWGVGTIGRCLFVLRSRTKEQVELYQLREDGTAASSTSGSITLVQRITIPRLRGVADMASCPLRKCLYVVDCVARCVHRVQLEKIIVAGEHTVDQNEELWNLGRITEWPVNDDPWGVSVTPEGNVLITCDETQKLKEFTSEGQLLRVIRLPKDVANPCHSVLLPVPPDDNARDSTAGRYVVCHGAGSDLVHRICLVDAEGQLHQSYGGSYQPGVEATDGDSNVAKLRSHRPQLDGPRHLAADGNGFIFVADFNNARVSLLSPALAPVVNMVVSSSSAAGDATRAGSKTPGLQWNPWRLHFDKDGGRLYVAENEWKNSKWASGRVVAFKL